MVRKELTTFIISLYLIGSDLVSTVIGFAVSFPKTIAETAKSRVKSVKFAGTVTQIV
jgi:hypothetical protein